MPKFLSKVVEIEAMLWAGGPEEATQIISWVIENGGTATWSESHEGYSGPDGSYPKESSETLKIRTLEGALTVTPGHWIIRGTEGESIPARLPCLSASMRRYSHGR